MGMDKIMIKSLFFRFPFITGFLIFLINCYNPFFPKTITPPHEENLLSTPEGVIKQLQISYETKHLDLFKQLIYSDSLFRFYIQHNIYKKQNLKTIDKINRTVTLDTLELDNTKIPQTEYWYLTSTQEIDIHKKLFNRDNEIEFLKGLQIKDKELKLDSSNNRNEPDSLYILSIEKPVIQISSPVIYEAYGTRSKSFDVGEQTFVVKKAKINGDELWKILYWFELDAK